MNRSPLGRLALALVAAPLALGLAACSKEESAATSGEPIARIAPPAGQAWAETVTRTPEGGYLIGNPNAPIKLLEFAALSCSHCAEFAETSGPELRDDFVASGRVSHELRLFMLNALDMPAALLVTCGAPEAVPGLSDQFWAWQGTMFENLQKADQAQMKAIESQQPPASFASLARLTGMDQFITSRGIAADQAAACLADTGKATELAKQTQDSAAKYQITGTPTFMINGQKVEQNAWPALKTRLQEMGAR
jgi:protein-disulfide isomerase